MKTKYPVYIMVFGVVTSDGNMPPFILPHGIKLNTAQSAGAIEYTNCISAEG